MDNAIATDISPHTATSTAHAADHEHLSLPQHRHHFETEQQQREAGSFGMWLFLLTEIMFFGGMFFAYLLYRNWYYPAFAVASNQLSVTLLGGINTAVLITSGFFMALGVWAAEVRKRSLLTIFLVLTMVFGWVFIGIKGVEWTDEIELHHVPGISYDISRFVNPAGFGIREDPLPPDMAQRTQVFFFLILRHDGYACCSHADWFGFADLADISSAWRGEFSSGVCSANRELWTLLALCRYCLALSVSVALPNQPTSTEVAVRAARAPTQERNPMAGAAHATEANDELNMTNPEHVEHHIVSPLQYCIVFGTLLLFTLITVGVAYLDLKWANPVLALAIACFKAVIVILFFMHAKYQSRLIKMTIGSGFSCFWF